MTPDSVDGTKVAASASKHAAVSHERAGQTIARLELEVQQLLTKAEQADATPLQDALSIPEEIVRRQKRKAALEGARARIEARVHARYAGQLAEHEKKMAVRLEREERGEKPRGPVPKLPRSEPDPKEQTNFTDPESRIMKSANGYVQACTCLGRAKYSLRRAENDPGVPANRLRELIGRSPWPRNARPLAARRDGKQSIEETVLPNPSVIIESPTGC